MKVLRYVYFGTLVLILSCSTKQKLVDNISCMGKVTVQFDGTNYNRNTNAKIPKGSKSITVIFLAEFKDSIKGYIDNKLIYQEFVNQRDSDDSHRFSFGRFYDKESKPPILKIESLSRKTCFDIEVDRRYNFVYVWPLENGKWQARFSNSYYIP